MVVAGSVPFQGRTGEAQTAAAMSEHPARRVAAAAAETERRAVVEAAAPGAAILAVGAMALAPKDEAEEEEIGREPGWVVQAGRDAARSVAVSWSSATAARVGRNRHSQCHMHTGHRLNRARRHCTAHSQVDLVRRMCLSRPPWIGAEQLQQITSGSAVPEAPEPPVVGRPAERSAFGPVCSDEQPGRRELVLFWS
jgi:hypothetical protein